jgi:hypothetical protein
MDVVNDASAMFSVGWPVARGAKILKCAKADPKINGGFVRAEKRAVDARRPHAFFMVRDVLGAHGGDRPSLRGVAVDLAANAENRAIIMAPNV